MCSAIIEDGMSNSDEAHSKPHVSGFDTLAAVADNSCMCVCFLATVYALIGIGAHYSGLYYVQ